MSNSSGKFKLFIILIIVVILIHILVIKLFVIGKDGAGKKDLSLDPPQVQVLEEPELLLP